jgi:hypothetical protein
MEPGQIRLLEVHSGKPEDIVLTSLMTVELLKAPAFEALSYVWGNYQERASIKIDGQAVEIHLGLFNAIHTLRSTSVSKLMWVDAICIYMFR